MGWYRKSGGSFKGRITSVELEQTDWTEGKKPHSTFTAKLVIDKDGAEDALEQYLSAGFIYPDSGEAIEDNTLTGGAAVGDGSEFQGLVQSAVDNGMPEEVIGDGTNFDFLTNYRFEFGRVQDTDRQIASGSKKLKITSTKDGEYVAKGGKTYTEEQVMEAGRRKGKDGKYYNQMRLVITAVIGEVEAETSSKSSKSSKSTSKTTTKDAAPTSVAAKNGKANGAAKSKKEAEADVEAMDSFLVALLEDAPKSTLKKNNLTGAVVKHAKDLPEGWDRNTAINLLRDEEFLGRNNGWSYDEDAGTLSLA